MANTALCINFYEETADVVSNHDSFNSGSSTDASSSSLKRKASEIFSKDNYSFLADFENESLQKYENILFGLDKKHLERSFLREKTGKSVSIQKWEGVVTSVFDSSFEASLIDLRDNSPDEIIEIDFDEVSPDDLSLVEAGAVFYLNIENNTDKFGQLRNSTVLRFRRLPAWSRTDLEKAKKGAQEMMSFFGCAEE